MKYDQPDDIWDGISPCPTHPIGTALPDDWDACDGCQGEALARGAVIDQMGAEAQERMGGLAKQGVPYPATTFVALRLEVLIDSLLGDPRSRTLYEGEVGRRTMNVIKNMQEEVRQQQGGTIITPGDKRLTVVRNKPRS